MSIRQALEGALGLLSFFALFWALWVMAPA